jgi:hypothetical protein
MIIKKVIMIIIMRIIVIQKEIKINVIQYYLIEQLLEQLPVSIGGIRNLSTTYTIKGEVGQVLLPCIHPPPIEVTWYYRHRRSVDDNNNNKKDTENHQLQQQQQQLSLPDNEDQVVQVALLSTLFL